MSSRLSTKEGEPPIADTPGVGTKRTIIKLTSHRRGLYLTAPLEGKFKAR